MKLFYLLPVCLFSLGTFAQTGTTEERKDELNCYNKWAQKFHERGAEEVADGAYDDIIITVRKGQAADCYNGKAVVKDKKVLSLFIQREDGTYEEVKWDWKDRTKTGTINNGMSSALITKDNKLVNVLWPKKLKPKKAPFKKAPDPIDD